VALSITSDVMETWILELDRGTLNKFTFEGGNQIPVRAAVPGRRP
jgi:hypothetical protein